MEILYNILVKLRNEQAIKYIPQNGVICDIGCGKKPKLLLRINDFITAGWGIDKQTENYNWTSKIHTINQDIDKNQTIPCPPNYFDCVLMVAVIEHLQSPSTVLTEICRILKPGGVVVITTPTPKAKVILDILSYIDRKSGKDIKDHKRDFNYRELFNILGTSKLKVIHHHYFEFGLNQLALAQKQNEYLGGAKK